MAVITTLAAPNVFIITLSHITVFDFKNSRVDYVGSPVELIAMVVVDGKVELVNCTTRRK